MAIFHYSDHQGFDEAMVGFTDYCRLNGMGIGLSHAQEALQLCNYGFANDFNTLRFALKSLFCSKEEDFEIFEKCFAIYWRKQKHEYAHKIQNRNRSNVTKKANASLVMAGFNPNGEETEPEEEAKNISGASRIESLKKTDFSKLNTVDNEYLDSIANDLLRQLNHRLKRKLERTKKGKVDLRNTIRKNLSNGDLLLELTRRNRKLEKYRLILLLDVSGSMDKYSFFLLKFIWSLKSNLKQIEAFIFSTKLVRITEMMDKKQLDRTLLNLSDQTDNWSGGTKIGECLKEFNDNFSKRILNGKSITIILSDGLDTGETNILSEQLYRIRMRTNKLVWLNPLKGSENYLPEAKGMKAALQELDYFESAHNFESLEKLENILADV